MLIKKIQNLEADPFELVCSDNQEARSCLVIKKRALRINGFESETISWTRKSKLIQKKISLELRAPDLFRVEWVPLTESNEGKSWYFWRNIKDSIWN